MGTRVIFLGCEHSDSFFNLGTFVTKTFLLRTHPVVKYTTVKSYGVDLCIVISIMYIEFNSYSIFLLTVAHTSNYRFYWGAALWGHWGRKKYIMYQF